MMIPEVNTEKTLKRLVLLCIAITGSVSGLAIAGWVLNFLIITRISYNYIPMAPSTALSFLILSVALFLHTHKPQSSYGIMFAGTFVFLVLLMCSMIFIDFFVYIAVDPEQLLLQNPEKFGTIPIGRMSPITAANFLMACSSLLLLLISQGNKQRTKDVAASLGIAVCSVGLVMVLGYLYGTPVLYGGTIIPVALTTAIAFVFLGIGLVAVAGQSSWPINQLTGLSVQARLMRTFLPVTILIVLVYGWLHDIIFLRTTNPALISSLFAILSFIAVAVIVIKISRGIGGEIDSAETKRRQAEEALRESEGKYYRMSQEFRALLDANPDILTLHDSDLRIIWANRGVVKEFGKDASELVGQYCHHLWHKSTKPCNPCPVLRSFETGSPESDQAVTPDGRIWDIRAVPVKDADGKVINVIQVGRDITEHRKLEDQLRQSQKMEVIGQLAGGVAHDFNNILTAIIGYGEILKNKISKDEPLRFYVEQIFSSAKRAADLTRNLLAFSRKQLIDLRPLNINDVVKRVKNLLARVIGEDIELNLMLTDKDPIVKADSSQIEQVLINVAANARDAMLKGGILSIHTEVIELDNEFKKIHGYGKLGIYSLISVTDTGVGMDKKTREKIFEPFFTTKGVGKGTGLGLSMAYGIIKQHNGYINCYSEPDKGTTFNIYLPIIESGAEKND